MATDAATSLSITDNVRTDHRYRGFMYDKQNPRIPITGPIGFRSDEGRKFPLPNSLVQGKPVFPTTPARGFFFGSDNVRDMSEEERKERRINLRLLQKTSADLRKLKRAQDEQVEFLREHREVRKQEAQKRRKEQEDDLKMLKSYYPFGKPGYGAPRGPTDNAMTKSLRNENGVGVVIDPNDAGPQHMSAREWKKMFPPGAPERLHVRRYEDDNMRRYAVDRETAEQYKKELDELRHIKKQNEDKIKTLDRARERDSIGYDPFGKPGAGAPNRDDKGHYTTKRSISISYVNNPMDARHAERVNKKIPKVLNDVTEEDGKVQVARHYKHVTPIRREDGNVYDPWEKDLPKRDDQGNARRFPRAGDNGIYEFIDPDATGEVFPRKHVGGGGEPLVAENGEKLTKRMGLLTTIHGARKSENIPRVATPQEVREGDRPKSPWGRPGAGAPLKDDIGNIVKNTKGRIDRERENLSQTEASRRVRAKELYRSQLQEGMSLQRNLRDEEKQFQRKPAGDVPSWFSKGKVGRPTRDPETGLIQPQKRVMSDVTAQKLATDRPRDVEAYYRELQEQANERKRMRVKEKERVAQLEAKHHTNFQDYFNRPGGGAPRADGNARRKFSTSAIQAQVQGGTQVFPSHHKTTLQSALYLPYCHDSMETVLHSDVIEDAVGGGDVITTLVPSNEETLRSDGLCANCPLRANSSSLEVKDVTSPPALDTSSSVTSPGAASDKCSLSTIYRAEIMPKPFPYRVVAPWAIDA